VEEVAAMKSQCLLHLRNTTCHWLCCDLYKRQYRHQGFLKTDIWNHC